MSIGVSKATLDRSPLRKLRWDIVLYCTCYSRDATRRPFSAPCRAVPQSSTQTDLQSIHTTGNRYFNAASNRDKCSTILRNVPLTFHISHSVHEEKLEKRSKQSYLTVSNDSYSDKSYLKGDTFEEIVSKEYTQYPKSLYQSLPSDN